MDLDGEGVVGDFNERERGYLGDLGGESKIDQTFVVPDCGDDCVGRNLCCWLGGAVEVQGYDGVGLFVVAGYIVANGDKVEVVLAPEVAEDLC